MVGPSVSDFTSALARLVEIEKAGMLDEAMLLPANQSIDVPAMLLHDFIEVYRHLQALRNSTIVAVSGKVELESDDGGQAAIAELGLDDDDGFFVRLQSWSEQRQHPILKSMDGKNVRVIVIED